MANLQSQTLKADTPRPAYTAPSASVQAGLFNSYLCFASKYLVGLDYGKCAVVVEVDVIAI